ncbi:MAG TPA: hypothetical protein VMW75_10365, partial [Thermoanaerobaculia bacterium]|nr:hypothetical protein [Thermoanaerobaculia bacterium]
LDPDRLAVVAVGPAEPLRAQLAALGEVTVRTVDDLATGTRAPIAEAKERGRGGLALAGPS